MLGFKSFVKKIFCERLKVKGTGHRDQGLGLRENK